jgi:cytochrome c553
MSNNRLSTVFGVLVVLAVLAIPANAVEEVAALPTPGNAAEAEAFLGAKLLVCNTCHGGNGVPHNAATPIIWGQQENYLTKQLRDFHSDARNSEVMRWMATALTPAELQSAATYFANKSWPAAKSTSATAGGPSPPAMLAVCQACHQQNFVGGLPAPRLAGQKYEYLVAAMQDYAAGKRTNNTEMMRMMEAVSPAEREAIARYLSGL